MEYKITEEQIKEAHSVACKDWKKKIESWFPECFKSKLEAGKWYKNKGSIINYQGGTKGYGYFGAEDVWCNTGNDIWTFDTKPQDWQPTTESEVFEMLKKEAKKRGLKINKGLTVITPTSHDGSSVKLTENGFSDLINGNTLLLGNYPIYSNGNWATIVETPKEMTLEEIEKQLGHKVKIVS